MVLKAGVGVILGEQLPPLILPRVYLRTVTGHPLLCKQIGGNAGKPRFAQFLHIQSIVADKEFVYGSLCRCDFEHTTHKKGRLHPESI